MCIRLKLVMSDKLLESALVLMDIRVIANVHYYVLTVISVLLLLTRV